MQRTPFVFLSVLCFAALWNVGCKPSEDSNVKAIVGAVLIDGTGGGPVTDSVVVIAGSRIRAVGSRANVPIPAGSEKIDGRGKFLLPGLIDLHVHLGTTGGPGFRAADYTRERVERNLNQYLYFGVTSVRSIGTEREAGLAIRNDQREGPVSTARLFTCGRGFTAPGGHPSQEVGAIARQPATPEEARTQVTELAGQRVDGIKIWVDDLGGKAPKVKPAVIEAILEEARKHKIPVTAHIHSLADTMHLVENGAAGFLHMVRDTENVDPSFISRLRDLRIPFAPTLVRQELGWLFAEHPERLDDPDAARAFEPATLAAIREQAKGQAASASARELFERARRNTKQFASGGVPIGVGSDGGSSIDLPGLMTHREMELLVESGLSPMDVVVAATRTGALALQKLDDLGTIERGKKADLLLVTANPLEDIRNLRKIHAVLLDGQWVDRAGLKLK
jgi:imidazolonepropionase-like amidohydrolase